MNIKRNYTNSIIINLKRARDIIKLTEVAKQNKFIMMILNGNFILPLIQPKP